MRMAMALPDRCLGSLRLAGARPAPARPHARDLDQVRVIRPGEDLEPPATGQA